MAWYLWMVAGGVVAFAGLFFYVLVMNFFDDKSSERQQAIRSRQASAEQDMQKMVQATITQMFNATRGWPL